MEFNNLYNCGLVEMAGISEFRTAEGCVAAVVDYFKGIPSVSHFIFSQAMTRKIRSGYGFRLAAYITKNQLGTVTASDSAVNPNSGNYIVVFVWAVDRKAISSWAKKRDLPY
jgi:hypothetical protein